ncbi:Aste57867_16330 [Aphanomyces stellatus]|uniref:Aste57867_16330 protein n=1 Tax=Aphanomyces stellatus TaxID=120398 RepID=A0A485L579_9STRA|nr:hypothetical protein As57867_016273 [Aphanomyces stellatus]VFT93106.1 Aste57867_16330 [Aphanomyces stellatus]
MLARALSAPRTAALVSRTWGLSIRSDSTLAAVPPTSAALAIIEDKLNKAVQSADWKQAMGTFQHLASTHPSWVKTKHANTVLRVCATQGRHREAKKVLLIMESLGLHSPASPESTTTDDSTKGPFSWSALETQALVIQALAENGKGDDALAKTRALVADAVAADPSKRDKIAAVVYKPLLKALKHKNNWQHTLTALKQMQEFELPINLRGYRLLFLTLGAGRQSKMLADVALQVLQSPRHKLDVATYTVMLKTLSASGEHAAVHQVFQKMDATESPDWLDSEAVDVNLYNAMIRAHMLAGNMPEARHLLTRLLAVPHLTPDAFCYTTCMLGYLRQDAPNQVTALYEDMKRRGIAPSALTLSCVLRAIKALPAKKFLLPKLLDLAMDVPLAKADFVHTLIDAMADVGQSEKGHLIFHRAMQDPRVLGEWRKGLYSINLHSFSKGSAKTAVQFALTEIATQPLSHRETLALQDLKIITGKGRGSKEFLKPVLKPEIEQMLLRDFGLRSHSPSYNPGCLIVTVDQLKKWIDKQEDNDQ